MHWLSALGLSDDGPDVAPAVSGLPKLSHFDLVALGIFDNKVDNQGIAASVIKDQQRVLAAQGLYASGMIDGARGQLTRFGELLSGEKGEALAQKFLDYYNSKSPEEVTTADKYMVQMSLNRVAGAPVLAVDGKVGAITRSALSAYRDGTFTAKAEPISALTYAQRDNHSVRVDGAEGGISNDETVFSAAYRVVMKHEGGYSNHAADRGGETIFGIASKFHPEVFSRVMNAVDAGNTEVALEITREFYKTHYWDKVGGDHLRPDVALVAFDTAVNHGVNYANRLLEQTGGDVDAMLAARDEKYDRIAQADPSQQAFARGWDNRLASLGRAAGSFAEMAPPSLA